VKPTELLPGLPSGARILLIRLRRLGDTVLSTPLYTALKNWRPDLRLTVLVETPNDEVLRNNPDLENVITIPTLRKGVLGKFAARWNLRGQIRAARFDCCINLHEGPTSAWLTALSGARFRAGLATSRNRLTCNVLVDRPQSPPGGRRLHTVENQIASLYGMGLPPGSIPPLRLVPDPSTRSGALSQLRRAGLDPDREYVVIHPAANFPSKEWPPDRFAGIVDEIRLKHGHQVAIVAGPGEKARAELVAKQSRSSPVIVHGVSVAELAWIIHGARLFIGNDSGPTHMAAALKVPIVVMFGSSDSQIWYPWTANSQFRVVQNAFACNPCAGSRCHVYGEPRCILSITLEQVKAAVAALLKVRNHVDP
jgi:predicted lipopolysaccharide heptosyltransferase III